MSQIQVQFEIQIWTPIMKGVKHGQVSMFKGSFKKISYGHFENVLLNVVVECLLNIFTRSWSMKMVLGQFIWCSKFELRAVLD